MRRISLVLLFASIAFSQTDIGFSLESKYGDGLKITNQGALVPDTSAYKYFENILDMNATINDNIFTFMQFEYSDPPIFGLSANKLNRFYMEYYQDKMQLKVGDLYSIFGHGTGFSTFIDQNIDYDNSIRGVEMGYDVSDDLRLYSLMGKGDYWYRTNPANLVSDRKLTSRAILAGAEIYTAGFGDFNLFYMEQQQEISEELILSYEGEIQDTRLARDLFSRIGFEEISDDTVYFYSRNFSWNRQVGPVEVYFEKSWNDYTKILGGTVNGSMFYGTLNTEVGGFGVTYEYKNYDMPYFIQTLSNPPTLFRESTSILASRNTHATNFSDEVGHQLEITGEIAPQTYFLGNASISYRHEGVVEEVYRRFMLDMDNGDVAGFWEEDSTRLNELSMPAFMDFIRFDNSIESISRYPYRQLYLELNGWYLNDKIYYRVGLDVQDEITKYHDRVDTLNAFTLTPDEMFSSVSNYFDAYWWDLWNVYFNATLDSAQAHQYFEWDYGAPVDSLILWDAAQSVDELTPVLSSPESSSNNYEKIQAVTFPLQVAFDLDDLGSVTIYLEHQQKKLTVNKNVVYSDGTVNNYISQFDDYTYQYISLTYRFPFRLSVSFFYDSEDFDRKLGDTLWATGHNEWKGLDLTYDINDNTQASLFFGSQKGGRVCANGICADQPGFEDGIKITLRSIF